MKKLYYFFLTFFHCYLFSQQCLSNAGPDRIVCGGTGSNFLVELDGTNSTVPGTSPIRYEWTSLDEGITFSNSQKRRPKPSFQYPQELLVDTDFRIQLKIYSADGECEDLDTTVITCKANMCPVLTVDEDILASSGCDLSITLDASGTFDPDNSIINFQWSSLDGLDENLINTNSSLTTFSFPSISSDQIYNFSITVDDSDNFITDTISVTYLKNSAPVANAGNDFTTCDPIFTLSANKSYDEDFDNLTYSWSLLDGDLELSDDSAKEISVTSPIDLEQDTDYHFELSVSEFILGEPSCISRDTIKVTIKENICPIANAGEDVRIAKFDTQPVTLSGVSSMDVDGEDLLYSWISPNGEEIENIEVVVTDLDPESDYSKYTYQLKVTDNQNAVSYDEVQVIFSNFSKPKAPKIYAVADHNRVLVSWDASAESSIDSLTGYADFEGYKLYRSIDGGITWGGDEDKLYDFDGNFVGWIPYAQFDLNKENDEMHCIYTNEDCGLFGQRRNTSFYGLDPFAPRFSLGTDSGIEYAFIDSSVVDGVEYTYTICAYDIGLEPFDMAYVFNDSTQTYSSDTLWAGTNPDKFMGPEEIEYFDVYGQYIRSTSNPNRGYPYLETDKGSSYLDKNFITVIPGYTASNITFPDERDIEAIFSSDSNNIGSGDRNYFIVDRNEIISNKILKYEIKASQGSGAVDGIAVEDPQLFVYQINSDGSTFDPSTFDISSLTFFEYDSLVRLPGSQIESTNILVPKFQLVQPLNRWSNMMDGIRFRFDNAIQLSPTVAPPIEPATYELYNADGTPFDSLKSAEWFYVDNIEIELSYTDLTTYKKRLNFDYEIEFFTDAVGDTVEQGLSGIMGLPFRITNLFTNKKVGLANFDFGANGDAADGIVSGAGDLTWTRNEEILLLQDSLFFGDELSEVYTFDLKINFRIPSRQKVNKAWSSATQYFENDTVFFAEMLWKTDNPSKNIPPFNDSNPLDGLNDFIDIDGDGINDNTWKPIYPWENGDKVIYGPQKFFENGDNWVSDMSILGKVEAVVDTTLDTIKVVPNPYIVRSRFNETPTSRKLRFVNLPQQCRIRIYTVSGELIRVLDHFNRFDGNEWWDLRSANNQEVAPGLYIYHVESDNGQEKVGKFAVIR